MKRNLFYLFFLLAALLATPIAASAQCTTSAGDLSSTAPISLCPGIGFSVSAAGDAVLDGDDVLLFIVSDAPGQALGNVLDSSTDGNFNYNANLVEGVTYYVKTVAGNNDGSGGIDYNDPCLSLSLPASLIYHQSPVANAGPSPTLNCFQTTVQLQGSGTTGAAISYQWSTTGGNIISGGWTLQPSVDQPGTYCLTVTNTINGCTASDCVVVTQDIQQPVADAGPGATLTCYEPLTHLQGVGPVGPQYVYQWNSTNGGNIVSGATVLNPAVNSPGTYCLTVTNTINGCTGTDCVLVNADYVFPSVSIAPPPILTCATTVVVLTAQAPTGPNYAYQWSGPGIISGQTALNPLVNTPGTYCVTVVNTANGCTSESCTQVDVDVVPPTVSAGATTMSCANPQALLSATVSPPGPNYAYVWSGAYGFTATTPDASPPSGLEALYTVTVTSPINGCTNTANVQTLGDSTMPRVDALVVPVLCGAPEGEITLTPNPPAQQLQYQWSTGATSEHVTGLLAGNYVVTISDTQSGCSKSIQYEITNQSILISSTVTPITCGGGANGAITALPQSGTPSFSFSWIGPNGFSSSLQTITGLKVGSYKVSVTDALGCTGVSDWIYVPQPVPLVVTVNTVQPSCQGQGSINITVSGGTPPYTYIWADGSTAEDISNISPGFYTMTVTDANGCFFSPAPIILPGLSSPQISAVVSNDCSEFTVFVQPTLPGSNYAYQWSNGNTTPLLTATVQGLYSLTVTDQNSGCTQEFSYSLSLQGQPCGQVNGRVVHDQNSNCIAAAAEPGLGGWIVRAVGANTFYASTDTNGYYTMGVLPGSYTVEAVLPNGLWANCAPVPVNLANGGDMATADIPVQAVVLCPAMSVDISNSQLRRCFSNNYYIVDYCNNGPAVATNAYVIVALDPYVYYVNSSISAIDLGNHSYKFLIGDVAPGVCNHFWVKVGVSCAAMLGQTHCTEAHIYPDTLCDNDPNWSGASVLVNAQCVGDSVHFAIKNAGTAPMTTSLDYIVIEDGIMFMQAGAPALDAGDSVVLSVPANGATWRVEANQEPFHPEDFLPVAVVEGCTVTGSFSTGYVQQFPNPDQGQAVDVDCTTNFGSYDPNDKQGLPIGYGPTHYIKPGTKLEYLIRFQNTGTDTAFNIVVRDTLSAWLDPSTVVPGASSHPYRFELTGEGIVVFSFDDILLPDSNVNEAASHGFVSFKIAQKPDIPLGTDIFNQAAIYFDFNDPVLTNTTYHRVGLNFIATAIFTPDQPGATLRILPNPLSASATVELEGWTSGQRVNVDIVNSTGRLLRRETAVAPRFSLDASALPEGLYFLKVTSSDGRTGVVRFVVN